MSGAYRIAITRFTATIAALASESDAVGLGNGHLVGIFMPAGWDAAALTFQTSIDAGVSWHNVMVGSSGAEASLAVAAGQYIAIDDDLWMGVNLLKIRSGTNALPVAQTADRVLTLVCHLHAW